MMERPIARNPPPSKLLPSAEVWLHLSKKEGRERGERGKSGELIIGRIDGGEKSQRAFDG